MGIDALDIALRGLGHPRSAMLVATLGRVHGDGQSNLTVFDDRLGEQNGRLRSASAASGLYAVVLGSDRPGVHGRLAVGDLVQITQDVDVTEDVVLRASLTMRTPDDVPDGFGWRASLILDGVEQASAMGWPGKTRSISDLGVPVSHLTGVRAFGVRLQLVEVAGG